MDKEKMAPLGKRCKSWLEEEGIFKEAGAMLLGATDKHIRLIDRFAGCFTDYRDADLVEHTVPGLVGQRIFGIALGYEDLIDHDQLRHDPVMAVLGGKVAAKRADCAPLAGKSTLNRLELSREEPTRYHKISYDAAAIEGLLLAALSPEFEKLYAKFGRPSIPPERLLRALLLQAFYSVRSEPQLMEQLDYNLLFRWFVGLSLDAAVWDVTVFTKNRERLIEGDIARKFMAAVLSQSSVKALLSDDHFSVDGTLIEAWASMKSFRSKDGSGELPAPGRNGERDFHGEKRSNKTHASTTDPDARLYRKGPGQARLSGARSDGEPARSGGRHASDLGDRHGGTRGRARDGGRPSGQSSDHARGRQSLRCGRVCR